jgi:hypothetical protein
MATVVGKKIILIAEIVCDQSYYEENKEQIYNVYREITQQELNPRIYLSSSAILEEDTTINI